MKFEELPIEIQNRMLDCQEEENKERDSSIFEEDICSGFFWDNTKEGCHFWKEVLVDENINRFFEMYPKYPKVMWVSRYSDFSLKERRVVFMEKCNKYLAWGGAETIEEAEK